MENQHSHLPQDTTPVILPPQSYPYAWPYPTEEEVSLSDSIYKILRHWFLILVMAILGAGGAVFVALKLAPAYRAEAAVLMIAQTNNPLSSLASQFGSIPLLGGSLAGLGGSGKTGQVIAILKSRTLLEKMINEFDLEKIILKEKWDPVLKQWKRDKYSAVMRNGVQTDLTAEAIREEAILLMQKEVVLIEEDKKTGLIKIQVELEDPKVATQLANRLVIELQDFINRNSLTVAKRNRIFIEQQLQKNKIEFLESGKSLNQFYNRNQVSSLQPNVTVDVGRVPEPPKAFEDFRRELEGLETQKSQVKTQLHEADHDGLVHQVPSQVYLQYLTLQRELLGKINTLLTQQYEIAKIEEAKEDLSFQLIDKAVIPIKPIKPKKMVIIAAGGGGGLFLGVLIALLIESGKKQKKG